MRGLGLVLILGLLVPTASSAAMYKWVDENGNVYYSDKKPPEVTSAQEIKKQSSGVTDEEAQENLESLTGKAADQQNDREVKASIAEEQATRDETIKKNCEIAKQNLTLLTSTARVTLKDENGEDYFLPDEEKESKTRDARAQVDRYCTDG